MALSPLGSNGLQGLNRSLDQVQQASERIARAGLDPARNAEAATVNNPSAQSANAPERTDVTQPLVELREAELNARANTRSIEAENKVIGSLLDIRV